MILPQQNVLLLLVLPSGRCGTRLLELALKVAATAAVLLTSNESLSLLVWPLLQEDGGDIVFRTWDEDTGIVTLKMMGACRCVPEVYRSAAWLRGCCHVPRLLRAPLAAACALGVSHASSPVSAPHLVPLQRLPLVSGDPEERHREHADALHP